MVTWKRLGLNVKRIPTGWKINGIDYPPNKGNAVLEYLREHAIWEGEWKLK
jgi:hypothetical protein